jgi:hypothetical protein
MNFFELDFHQKETVCSFKKSRSISFAFPKTISVFFKASAKLLPLFRLSKPFQKKL